MNPELPDFGPGAQGSPERASAGGLLADNLTGFGRALRRCGVRLDSAHIALAQQAALLVGLDSKADLGAALEAVLVNRERDRTVFRELFALYFGNPAAATGASAALLSGAPPTPTSAHRPRVREALAAQPAPGSAGPADAPIDADAAMSASDLRRLRHADFQGLGAGEYRLVERLARDIALPLPRIAARRTRAGVRGARLHWPGLMRQAARSGGELLHLPRRERQPQALPLLLLVDVSGSMERYARLLLAFLHAATREQRRRDVFAFGTELTDLTPAFRLGDSDAMLATAAALIPDYAGGTRLGESLATLRRQHAHRLVGRRTLVLLISDGLDTGAPETLEAELAWLRRSSRRILWLNPLLRFEGYAPLARGAALLQRLVHGSLAVHNLSRLQDLAAGLAALTRGR